MAKDPYPRTRLATFVRRTAKVVLGTYLRLFHRFELIDMHRMPPGGPAMVLFNHGSLLDIPALIVMDPYPNSTIIAKSSLFRVPIVRQVLDAYGAIAVDRQGRDLSAVRLVLGALREGAVLAVAAEGRRTRRGHLEAINPVLSRIAARSQVPLVPVGIVGSYRAMRPGAFLPRPSKVVMHIGEPFTLPAGTSDDEAASRIWHAIAALLPPDHLPAEPSHPPPAR